jgi:hypothetical protein
LQPNADGRMRRWDKILALNRTLHSSKLGVWVLWLDCDAVFTNTNAKWRNLIYNYPWQELVLNRDCNGMNSGVFFIKNTQFGRDFIARVYSDAAKRNFQHINGLFDQRYMSKIIDEDTDVQGACW